jgi:hypothetical protein
LQVPYLLSLDSFPYLDWLSSALWNSINENYTRAFLWY